MHRVEETDYPHYAIREALVNAVVHRDYSFTGSILIHIFENRIEIVSIGGLVSGLTMEDIFLGVSESRNKYLAACFYRLKLIESYGTGIQRIKESYQQYATAPIFDVSDHAFLVTLPNVNYNPPAEKNEEKALTIIKIKGSVKRIELEKNLSLSKSSVTIILNKLLSEGKIKQEGNARNTVYKLKD